jgi:hypothetical protein
LWMTKVFCSFFDGECYGSVDEHGAIFRFHNAADDRLDGGGYDEDWGIDFVGIVDQ